MYFFHFFIESSYIISLFSPTSIFLDVCILFLCLSFHDLWLATIGEHPLFSKYIIYGCRQVYRAGDGLNTFPKVMMMLYQLSSTHELFMNIHTLWSSLSSLQTLKPIIISWLVYYLQGWTSICRVPLIVLFGTVAMF